MKPELLFVRSYRTVFTAHTGSGRSAPYTFHVPVTMNMLSGGCLKTTVAVISFAAVDTTFFVMVVHVESVDTVGTARTIGSSAAIRAFSSHNYPLKLLCEFILNS